MPRAVGRCGNERVSVLAYQHDRQHAGGDGRIAFVGRMALHRPIVVVDLEHHPLTGNFSDGTVVLTVLIIVGGEPVNRSKNQRRPLFSGEFRH